VSGVTVRTRPVGLVLAIWCVATALIAHTKAL
jgi:hypothetical protein